MLREKAFGKEVLKWLWNSLARDVSDFLQEPAAMLLLCELLVHEGNESLIWRWIQVDTDMFDRKGGETGIEFRWRSFLLANLVRAKLHTTVGNKGKGDGAIRCLLNAAALKQSTNSRRLRAMSLWPSDVTLVRYLAKHIFRETDTGLWHELIILVDTLDQKYEPRQWRTPLGPRLRLYHPTAPDADPLVQAISSLNAGFDFPKTPNAQTAICEDIVSAMIILTSQGRDSDARALLNLAETHLHDDLYRRDLLTYEQKSRPMTHSVAATEEMLKWKEVQ